MKLPEIIGVAGTNGSGKDALADLRHERHGARKASLSDILRTEATRLGLDHSRENLRAISNRMGRELGAGALSIGTIEQYTTTRSTTENGLSIVSIRRPDEAKAIQSKDGAVVWIDAPLPVRYQRVQAVSRGRADDLVTFEEFKAQEDLEMQHVDGDPFSPNMSGVRDLADIHLTNVFTSLAEYREHLINTFELY